MYSISFMQGWVIPVLGHFNISNVFFYNSDLIFIVLPIIPTDYKNILFNKLKYKFTIVQVWNKSLVSIH